VFVHDRGSRKTTRLAAPADGFHAFAPQISTAGRHVAYAVAPHAYETNSVQNVSEETFVHDLARGTRRLVSVTSDGQRVPGEGEPVMFVAGYPHPTISGDGDLVAFHSIAPLVPDDGNGVRDVFVHQVSTGTTTRVSVSSVGAEADGASRWASLSSDGRVVVFDSVAPDLVDGGDRCQDRFPRECGDVFVHELAFL
jgi:Tol biopolymer transport system component